MLLARRGEMDTGVVLQRARPPVVLLDQRFSIVAADPHAIELLREAFPEYVPVRSEIPLVVARLLRESSLTTRNVTMAIVDLILHVSRLQGQETMYVLSVERRAGRDHLRRASIKFALSKREEEVLALIIGGGRAADIAHALSISVATVNGHFKNLMRKTCVRNRFELVARVFDS